MAELLDGDRVPREGRVDWEGVPVMRDRSPTATHWTWTQTPLRGLQRENIHLPEGIVAGAQDEAQRTARAGLLDSATL